jgi:hypothetical protein
MAVACPNCGKTDVQAGFGEQTCLSCRTTFDFQGNIVDPTGTINLVGNLADLQRMGQRQVAGISAGSVSDAFMIPPNVDPKLAKEESKKQIEEQKTDGLVNTPPRAGGDEVTTTAGSKK